jgi:hypothetical protein
MRRKPLDEKRQGCMCSEIKIMWTVIGGDGKYVPITLCGDDGENGDGSDNNVSVVVMKVSDRRRSKWASHQVDS